MAKDKPRAGLKKPAKTTHVRKAWAPGDTSMEEAEEWNLKGGGVSENVKEVGAMPNESVTRAEDNSHLR